MLISDNQDQVLVYGNFTSSFEVKELGVCIFALAIFSSSGVPLWSTRREGGRVKAKCCLFPLEIVFFFLLRQYGNPNPILLCIVLVGQRAEQLTQPPVCTKFMCQQLLSASASSLFLLTILHCPFGPHSPFRWHWHMHPNHKFQHQGLQCIEQEQWTWLIARLTCAMPQGPHQTGWALYALYINMM